MAFVSCKERPNSPTASADKDTLTFTRHFAVLMDSKQDDPIAVLSCGALPDYGSAFEFGTNDGSSVLAVLTGANASRAGDNSRLWYVELLYTLPETEKQQDPEQAGQDPTLDAPIIRCGVEYVDVELERVWINHPVQGWLNVALINLAGDKFDPVPIKKKKIPLLFLTRNEPDGTDVDNLINTYAGSICEPDEAVIGRKNCRCRSVNPEKVFRLSQTGLANYRIDSYYRISYEFEYVEAEGVLEVGARFKSGATKKFFVDEGRNRVGMLKADGTPLNGDGTYTPGDADLPVYTLPIYETRPITYAPLNLPTSIAECQAVIDLRG